jgi:hypothetical protein
MALTALTGVVAMHSYRDFLPQDRLKALLERRSDFRVEDNTVRVQYFTLRGNFLYSYERGARAFRLVFVVIGTMFLLPWIGLLRELAAEGVALGRWRRRVVGLLAAAPLALFPLGYDYGRWLAMLNVNLAVLILYLVGRDSRVIDRIGPRRIRVMLWMVALDLALGPYGISTPLH